MTIIQIELPEATAQAARGAGLLTPQALDRLLTDMARATARGAHGRAPGHARTIKELQVALQKALNRVRRHCKVLPVQLPEWERTANDPLPR